MKTRTFSILVRLLARTWRVHLDGNVPTGGCVLAFWHGEMLAVFATFGRIHPVALVSPSSDGKILQQLLRDWGHDIIEGSSSKGGRQALEQLVALAPTNMILITPDGPRGPAHVSKPGAVIIARRAGVPIVLVRVRSTPKVTFARSWDRFQVPLPFARITLHLSEPVHIPEELDEHQTQEQIRLMDERLHRLGAVTC